MLLRGNPTRSEIDVELDDDVTVRRTAYGLAMEFKVVGADQVFREAFEVLSAMSVNNPDAVRFGLWADEDNLWLRFCPPHMSVVDGWVLGKVPDAVRVFVTREDNWSLFEKFCDVHEYGLGLSLVGHQVDRHRVMSMADDDELDELSDAEFSGLIDGMKGAMSQEASVVVLRIRLVPDAQTGRLPTMEEGKVIDV
jgi:hypothetical protein